MQKNFYKNPMIHQDRKLGNSRSIWVQSFSCEDMRPLIICRGPIRKEAMDVFLEMGIHQFGILLSEKDSIVYNHALAPELRLISDPTRVHRVPDYTGANKEEREQRIEQIIRIAKDNYYDSVFAGYGFMAEDENLVAALEEAGLVFIGPCSHTVHNAGLKDEAKRTALKAGVSVTPGIDNVSVLTVVREYNTHQALIDLARQHRLSVLSEPDASLETQAQYLLNQAYQAGIDLYTIDQLAQEVQLQVANMYRDYPQNRIRLKAIGGGGGKGQRILQGPMHYEGELDQRIMDAAKNAPEMVREILNEVKATGVGDNKNVLIELNIETTRHQEIQLLGNGQWCVALGGRDCSLQMHEQKLLEVSVTQESLKKAIEKAKTEEYYSKAKALEQDLDILKRMEFEAESFGQAVRLDSVSTFECIVDRDRHFFMEVNTRIQVEHRVTELCYALKFTNPDNSDDYFIVNSLVEAMVLLAKHKQHLPKPERLVRENASLEARLNATNEALMPHAGGTIEYWSKPVRHEIRDDQGICVRNPDTKTFMKYTLAGAYDSNIALVLTTGKDRWHSYRRLSEILRSTKLKGEDLKTNLEFHYGLVNWFLGVEVYAKATTGFILPYLTMVGLLKSETKSLDLSYAYQQLHDAYQQNLQKNAADEDIQQAYQTAFERKKSLILRPLEYLLENPHVLSGWLSLNRQFFTVTDQKVIWYRNPIYVLNNAYQFLNMDYQDSAPAAFVIWSHDYQVLKQALNFYEMLTEELNRYSNDQFIELDEILRQDQPQGEFDLAAWQAIQSAHIGFQSGLELLGLLPLAAKEAHFFDIKVNDDLTIHIPERLQDKTLQQEMMKVLVPPPVAKADEVAALCGGMYYPREAPGMPQFVTEGDHFNEGDPLYIIEVMKMFNKVYAPFSGTIDQILVEEDGVIVKKGQPLFKVTPDEKVEQIDEKTVHQRRQVHTDAYLQLVLKASL